MSYLSAHFSLVADIAATTNSMQTFIHPIVVSLFVLAGIVAVGFIVNGGIQMITSSGRPEKLQHAKHIIRNAIIGLVVVLAAVTLTGILTNTFTSSGSTPSSEVPALAPVQPTASSGSLVDVLVEAITGLLRNIIESAAQPFIGALGYFTNATPLMSPNSSVLNLWLAILAIADVLFILVVILLGFHIMSASSLGIDELEFKHLIPQLILIFMLMNSSIFLIDGIVSLSNGMINALKAGFSISSVWDSLKLVAEQSKDMKLAALLVFIVFIVLSIILLIYYILRLVILYIGAVLAPLVLLLWLVPSFKDFAINALRTYLTTVFVLFIHVVILVLAASIFNGMIQNDPHKVLDPVMSTLVGVATLLALLKTEHSMSSLVVASAGARSARRLGGQFMYGIDQATSRFRDSRKVAAQVPKTVTITKVVNK
ncbi:MAG: pilin [Candidatus Saccharimonadales bacterium]